MNSFLCPSPFTPPDRLRLFAKKIPETPIWLLSRHRDEDAAKALQWLRGWVSKSTIQKELDQLKKYREFANSCSDCQAQQIKCCHPPSSLSDKIIGLRHASYGKPMLIVVIAVFFTQLTAVFHITPFMAQILNTYETPISPEDSTVTQLIDSVRIFTESTAQLGFHTSHLQFFTGLMGFVGTIVYMALIKFTTKRSLYMFCIAGAALSNLWLGNSFTAYTL